MFKHLKPSEIHPPFANYSHGVVVPENAQFIYCSGQLGIDANGEIPSGTEAQAKLCFQNIEAILKEAGATLKDVVRINAFVSGREHLQPYMKARDQFYPEQPAPASTLMIVSGFAREEFTVEIEAIAALPA